MYDQSLNKYFEFKFECEKNCMPINCNLIQSMEKLLIKINLVVFNADIS
jgi:hypothetical protein